MIAFNYWKLNFLKLNKKWRFVYFPIEDYNKVLARGYAMLKDHHNNYIWTVSEVQSYKYITANLKDGQIKLSRFNKF